jgi:hypothetical protein
MCRKPGTNHDGDLKQGDRSQVQGSTFKVKDKEGIKGLKFSLELLLSVLVRVYFDVA